MPNAERGTDPRHFTLEDFHSADAAMNRCLDLARVAARTDLPVLILGESGTGKTLLASAIHASSGRSDAAFVSFNAAALSDTLMDSQLFGHEKGAFTGAASRVKGKFEAADGGTLFFDEIADMSLTAQAKILRAVEYGEFERLGSEKLLHADVRLISATHLPLAAFSETARFRRDLFFRLSGITITLPPLRERPEDLPSLVAAQIELAARQQRRTITGLARDAADLIFSYGWPGNLRELDRVIRAAVSLTPGDVIPVEAILVDREAVSASTAPLVRRAGAAPGEEDLTLDAASLRHIRTVIERTGGNKRQAARLLGVSRSTLDRKLRP
ncbi:MAG TPA: sigma 54-interacting transcriptional regulator [Nevskiaceae bacterium]|nr:sigma 54-interacting transcriptional regulator [Nevskiaceae bacterium]